MFFSSDPDSARPSLFGRLGAFIATHHRWVLLGWLALALLLWRAAPSWEEIANDGDLAYLPPRMSSVQGERLLESAFVGARTLSQVAVVAGREREPLRAEDIYGPLYDLARRFRQAQGAVHLHRFRQARDQAAAAQDPLTKNQWLNEAQSQWNRADNALSDASDLAEQWAAHLPAEDDSATALSRMAGVFVLRAQLFRDGGRDAEAASEWEQAQALDPSLSEPNDELPAYASRFPLLDVWTWKDAIYGPKLTSTDQRARLIVLHSSEEFLATGNMPLVTWVEEQIDQVRSEARAAGLEGLRLEYSGSAAVGSEMLRSARDGIRYTEFCTAALVILILCVIYRAPLLVAAPLVTIAVSLTCSVSLVALLCEIPPDSGLAALRLKVFTTTKIFVVVILFGAGTDFCLFMIARYREELARTQDLTEAMGRTLAGVGDALAASALTTILALAAMAAAEYEKFRYSGPIIGVSLAVTLACCLTLTPSLLAAFGRRVFWPGGRAVRGAGPASPAGPVAAAGPAAPPADAELGGWERMWFTAAYRLTRRPGWVLLVAVAILSPLAWQGWRAERHVSYNFLGALDPAAPARRGALFLRQFFPAGEGGPLTILVQDDRAFHSDAGVAAIAELTSLLSKSPGVRTVRSFVDPLGDYPPGEAVSLLTREAWKNRISRLHKVTERLYLGASSSPDSRRLEVARLDVVLNHDPFSLDAVREVQQIERRFEQLRREAPQWSQARFLYAGMPAGLRDLREVTQSDSRTIKILVVVVVLLVLLAILRRPLLCLYLVASVLFSYYITIGLTDGLFTRVLGQEYYGLDWKTPLFLFVILVAVGQDYNVYLATRVLEEQRRRGGLQGLRVAVAKTGGIITSCGLIMAGAFITMTSAAWTQALQSLAPGTFDWLGSPRTLTALLQLGFALSTGILLDTFVVRPVLVPAFMAWIQQRRSGSPEL